MKPTTTLLLHKESRGTIWTTTWHNAPTFQQLLDLLTQFLQFQGTQWVQFAACWGLAWVNQWNGQWHEVLGNWVLWFSKYVRKAGFQF